MSRTSDYKRRFRLAAKTEKLAVIMTKVRIRQAVAAKPWPRWHILDFCGRDGGESRGVVDLIAIRKDHKNPPAGAKRGDSLQIILIQVKGGNAARPTAEDAKRLAIVARRHRACGVVLAIWKKGGAARFASLQMKSKGGIGEWSEVRNLSEIFG